MNKAATAVYKLFLIAFVTCSLSACIDHAVIDTSEELSGRTWSYTKKVSFPVKIEDAGKAYNIYFNLRHTGDYRYSNIFVLIHQKSPEGKLSTVQRIN